MRDGWTQTTIGEIAEVIGGGTPSTSNSSYWNGDIIWLTPTEVVPLDGGIVSDSERKITRLGLEKSGARLLPAGSVILTSRASVGFVAIAGKALATNQGFQSLVPKSHVDATYLMYWIQQNRNEFESRSAGSTFKEISKANVKAIKLLLPGINEQKRIVDVVSAVDEYIAALQRQADAARTARTAVLHELLTAGGDDWVATTLGDVLEIARGGSPRPIREYLTDEADGVNWVKIGDASASTKYITTTAEKIRQEGVSRSRRVNKGDFILSNSMSFGRPYIMRTDGCIHDGWLLLSGVTQHFDEDFLYNLLLSDEVQRQFNSLAAGSGVRNLNIEVVSEVRILLPSRQTQIEIASLANLFDEHVNLTELAIDKVKSLRSGLLSDLLSGEHEIPESYDRLLGAA